MTETQLHCIWHYIDIKYDALHLIKKLINNAIFVAGNHVLPMALTKMFLQHFVVRQLLKA